MLIQNWTLGKLFYKKKVKIKKNETAKSLEKKVLKIEHNIYPIALNKILTNF